MSLETIDEYEYRRTAEINNLLTHLTGIACPKCGHEMRDTNVSLMSNPARKEIFCIKCDNTETVLA